MQHLAPVRLSNTLGWQPDVDMGCSMEAIRDSLEFREAVDVSSWREHPATQRTWV